MSTPLSPPPPGLFGTGLRARFLGAALLLLGALIPLSLAAQTTGAVTGRVSNADTGGYLNNAKVTVQGTQLETFTNEFGEYRLLAVPVGVAKLQVFYTGLPPLTKEVTVAADQPAQADFDLTAHAVAAGEAAYKLDAYVVAAHKDTNQRSIATNEQRFAPNFKTVVAANQFGDITEGNVGEFVKFLPGITVGYTASDVRTINIRGVGSQYTAIMLDGYRVASANSGSTAYSSTGGGTRTVELEQISIGNASRIEIVKARTPDLPADALGGSLNLISKSAFEYKAPEVSYKVLAAMNSKYMEFGPTAGPDADTSTHKVLPGLELTYVMPVNHNFGFTFSLTDSNIYNPQYRSNPSWAPSGTGAAVTGISANNPFLEKYTMQDGPKVTHRNAFSITTDWKFTPDDVLSVRFQDNFYNNFFGNRNMNFDTGATAPVSFSPSYTNGALGKGSVNFGSSFRNKFGVTYNLGSDWTHNGSDWTLTGGVNYSHAAAHYHDYQNGYFSAATYAISNATVQYSDINSIYPAGITVLNKTGTATLGNVFNVTNPNYALTSISNNPVDAEDVVEAARVSAKRTVSWFGLQTKLQVGAQVQQETRDIESYKVGYTPTGALATAGAINTYGLTDSYNVAPPYIPYSVIWPSNRKLWDLYGSSPGLFTPTTATNLINEINGSLYFNEIISSAYAMGDTKALNNRLRVVYGIRVEQTKQEGNGPLALKSGSTTTYTRRGAHATNDYAGGYPSVNVSYNIQDNLIARVSYNRAIGRPDIANVVPNVSLPDSTVSGQTVTVSNPLLKAEQADNFDVSLEYYFKDGGVLSAAGFRKDFTNFWGSNNVTGPDALTVLQSLGVTNAQDYVNMGDVVKTPINVGTARVTGIELNYNQPLDIYVPGWAKGISVFANATAIHLRGAPNADFSAFVSRSANWGFAYDTPRFGAKLNWNYRGRERDAMTTVSGLNYWEYFRPRLYIDANLEFRFTKTVALFINARNLTDVPQDYEKFADGITPSYAKLNRREKFGASYTIGLKGTF